MNKANDHYILCRDTILCAIKQYQLNTKHSDALVVSMLIDIIERNYLDGQTKIKIQLRQDPVRV